MGSLNDELISEALAAKDSYAYRVKPTFPVWPLGLAAATVVVLALFWLTAYVGNLPQ